jgi:spoIIIJ-associated protein
MIDQDQTNKIREIVEEFFGKMTLPISNISVSSGEIAKKSYQAVDGVNEENSDVINLNIKVEEPQILIGQGGQTLFEIQRLLRNVLNKKMEKAFYLNLDINDYKKQKVDYLKDLVKDLADEVASTKKEKVLSPMSSYERRIVHSELAQRADISTESQGDGLDRHIVIRPI